MAEFHFLRPQMLLSLLPLLLVWWVLWRAQDSYSQLKKVVAPHLLQHVVVGEAQRRRLRPVHLLSAIWLLAVLALAGPAWEREAAPFADDDAGLIVLLKVSATMQATDVQPSRLARAKHKLRDLLQVREGAATGLIVYSGSAHLVMPLTRDDRIVSAMVEDLTPELMPADGDALGEALRLAESVLKRASVPGSVLVMADGITPAQADAITAAKPALPIHFLSMSAPAAAVDAGMARVASAIGASVLPLSADESDVQRVAQRAQSDYQTVGAVGGGDRWRDAGYLLLPLIALLALSWSRTGWLVR